jgi:hypothetical protein
MCIIVPFMLFVCASPPIFFLTASCVIGVDVTGTSVGGCYRSERLSDLFRLGPDVHFTEQTTHIALGICLPIEVLTCLFLMMASSFRRQFLRHLVAGYHRSVGDDWLSCPCIRLFGHFSHPSFCQASFVTCRDCWECRSL